MFWIKTLVASFGFFVGILINIGISRKIKTKAFKTSESIIRHILIPILNLALWYNIFLKYSFSINFLLCSFFTSLLIFISFIDIKTYTIDNFLILMCLILSFLNSFMNYQNYLTYFLGFLAGGFVFLTISLLSGGNMGGGDIKLMFTVGMFLGLELVILTILLTFTIGTVFYLPVILIKKEKLNRNVALAPYITCSFYICVCFGEIILDAYYKFLL